MDKRVTEMVDKVKETLLAKANDDLRSNYDSLELAFNGFYKHLNQSLEIAKRDFLEEYSYETAYVKEQEQLDNLQQQLTKWREERHLSIESQQKNLVANILEELTEYARAKNDDERIDALCDICVFSINSYPDEFIPTIQDYNFNYKDILKLSQYILNNIYHSPSIIKICFYIIKQLGYEPYECMIETIKEISSRTGHYDESIGKFIKDVSDEAKAKWYKADYSKCKLAK